MSRLPVALLPLLIAGCSTPSFLTSWWGCITGNETACRGQEPQQQAQQRSPNQLELQEEPDQGAAPPAN